MTSNQIQVLLFFDDLKGLLVLRNSSTDMYLLCSIPYSYYPAIPRHDILGRRRGVWRSAQLGAAVASPISAAGRLQADKNGAKQRIFQILNIF